MGTTSSEHEQRSRLAVWVETAAMAHARNFPRVTPLGNGRALVTGGAVNAFTKNEIFDPRIGPTGGFAPAADSPIPLQAHLAVRLDERRILVGGGGGNGFLNPANLQQRCYIYDVERDAWERTGDLPRATWWLGRSPAIRLRSGSVLVCGGSSPNDAYVSNPATGLVLHLANRHTYVFDPNRRVTFEDNTAGAGRWTEAGLMPEAFRFDDFGPVFGEGAVQLPPELRSYSAGTVDHSLTLLPDGRALKVGGRHNQPGVFYGTDRADIFDPETGTWTAGAPLPSTSPVDDDGGFGGRIYHGAANFGDGLVLVTGGNSAHIQFVPAASGAPATFKYPHDVLRRSGLTYDPRADLWTHSPKLDMSSPRSGHELVRRLDVDAVVAIGGRYVSQFVVTQPLTEILDARRGTWQPFATEPSITIVVPGSGTFLTTKQADFPVRFGALLDDGSFVSVAGADPTNPTVRLALAKELTAGRPEGDERALREPLVG